MEQRQEDVVRLRNRLSGILTLRWVIVLSAGALFAWGLGVLIARTVWDVGRGTLLWPAAAIVLIVPAAWYLAQRRVPSISSVRALLDGASRCGGLLMASEDHELGAWSDHMPTLRGLNIRWHGGKSLGIMAAAAAFAIVAFAIPNPTTAIGNNHSLEIRDQTDKLAEQLQVLEEEKILDHERAQALKEKLEQLRRDASGDSPVNTLDPLDHLRDQMAQAAREAAEKALGETEKLAKAQALAQGLQRDLSNMDAQTATEAAKELAQMAADAAADNKALQEMLDKQQSGDQQDQPGDSENQLTEEQLREACQSGKLSAEQIEKLAKALGKSKDNLSDMLSELVQAGLIDPAALSECEALGECRGGQPGDAEGLAQYLQEHEGEGTISELVGQWAARCSGRPGKGAPTRGRGDAAMTWTDGTDPQDMTFKEEALAPGAITQIKDSRLMGISIGAPDTDKTATDGQGTGLSGATAGSGAAHTHTLLPRHRGAVRRYFDRDKDKPKP